MRDRSNTFAIKAEVTDPQAETFAFAEQQTMYRGKYIAKGDRIFIFASENEGGCEVECAAFFPFSKISLNASCFILR